MDEDSARDSCIRSFKIDYPKIGFTRQNIQTTIQHNVFFNISQLSSLAVALLSAPFRSA